MKRKYEKPNMDLEMFEANEYIAACLLCDFTANGDKKLNVLNLDKTETGRNFHKACGKYVDDTTKKDGMIIINDVEYVGKYWWSNDLEGASTRHIHFTTNNNTSNHS